MIINKKSSFCNWNDKTLSQDRNTVSLRRLYLFCEEDSYKQLENNNGHSIQTYFTDEQLLINHYNISDDDDLPSCSHSYYLS